jgi:flagellar hook-length control protein FliK
MFGLQKTDSFEDMLKQAQNEPEKAEVKDVDEENKPRKTRKDTETDHKMADKKASVVVLASLTRNVQVKAAQVNEKGAEIKVDGKKNSVKSPQTAKLFDGKVVPEAGKGAEKAAAKVKPGDAKAAAEKFAAKRPVVDGKTDGKDVFAGKLSVRVEARGEAEGKKPAVELKTKNEEGRTVDKAAKREDAGLIKDKKALQTNIKTQDSGDAKGADGKIADAKVSFEAKDVKAAQAAQDKNDKNGAGQGSAQQQNGGSQQQAGTAQGAGAALSSAQSSAVTSSQSAAVTSAQGAAANGGMYQAGAQASQAGAQNAVFGGAVTPQMGDALAAELRGAFSSDIVHDASIVLKRDGGGTIKLALRPAELGNVKIHLEMAENKIKGHILVDNEEALRAFRQEIQALQSAFQDAGFAGAELEASIAQNNA